MPPLSNDRRVEDDESTSSTILIENDKERSDFPVTHSLQVHHFSNETSFAECTSAGGFVNPFGGQCPVKVNNNLLNLNLGQRWLTTDNKVLQDCLLLFHRFFVNWWEQYVLWCAQQFFPETFVRTFLVGILWKYVYFPLQKVVFGRSTGLHPSVSSQCHALSIVMFLGHFVLHSVARLRFGLRLAAVATPPPKGRVEHLPNGGIWIHAASQQDDNDAATTTTILWIFAGAYLSGCPEGNVGFTDALAQAIGSDGVDVYIPKYRLAPEHSMDDIMSDIHSAYQWLVRTRRPGGRVVLGGWSAGAALCTRLLQELVVQNNNKNNNNSSTTNQQKLPLPVAGLLFSPFVKYAYAEPGSSMDQYSLHDWLVTRGIIRVGEETLQLEAFWGGDQTRHSPLCHSMEGGMPPLCVIVSEHEAVYDETCELVQKARKAGVSVTVGQWRFMPHGWYMFGGLIPEAERTVAYAGGWIRKTVLEK